MARPSELTAKVTMSGKNTRFQIIHASLCILFSIILFTTLRHVMNNPDDEIFYAISRDLIMYFYINLAVFYIHARMLDTEKIDYGINDENENYLPWYKPESISRTISLGSLMGCFTTLALFVMLKYWATSLYMHQQQHEILEKLNYLTQLINRTQTVDIIQD